MGNLRVHEWLNHYRLAPGDQPPPGFAADLDGLAPRLAESLAESLAAVLGDAADGDAVLLLPVLAVECTLDPGAPTEQVLRHWSGHLALALGRALEDPASGVVRFPSRAAFAARFITDLTHGRAWGRWWYRGFEGLRALGTGAAVRTLLSGDAAAGWAALALIEEADWPALAVALGPREALRILCAWQEQEPSAGAPGGTPTGPGADAGTGTAGPPGATTLPAPLLALWLLAHPRAGAPAPVGLACWLALLLTLAPARWAAALADPAAAADLETRPPGEATADPDWRHLLASTPATQRRTAAALAAAARPAATPAPVAAKAGVQTWLDAPLGGLAWLLPALLDLLTADLADALGAALREPGRPAPIAPAAGAWSPLDAAALVTLAIAAGAGRPSPWDDPFWRAFFRLPPTLDPPTVLAPLAARDPAPAAAALAAALRVRALREPVALRLHSAGQRQRFLVERGSGCRLHPGHWPGPDWPPAPRDHQRPGPDWLPPPWRERLALSRSLARDLAALDAAPVCAALPGAWRDLFATLAQGTLRRTANRIPGAARSTLPYLFANVLGVGGRAQAGAQVGAQVGSGGTWVLELRRPPLYCLLSLNGLARLRLNWPDGRRLALDCEP